MRMIALRLSRSNWDIEHGVPAVRWIPVKNIVQVVPTPPDRQDEGPSTIYIKFGEEVHFHTTPQSVEGLTNYIRASKKMTVYEMLEVMKSLEH